MFKELLNVLTCTCLIQKSKPSVSRDDTINSLLQAPFAEVGLRKLILEYEAMAEVPKISIDVKSGILNMVLWNKNVALVQSHARHEIRIRSSDTGEQTSTLKGHTQDVNAIKVLPGEDLASGSSDGTIRIWSNSTHKCERVLGGPTGVIRSLAVLPNEDLASGRDDGSIVVWDYKTGDCKRIMRIHTGSVRSLEVLPSGQVASGAEDNTIQVWDSETGQSHLELRGYDGWSQMLVRPNGDVVFTSDDPLIPSQGPIGTIKVFSTDTGECKQVLQGHVDVVNVILLLPGERLASASDNGTIRIWNMDTGVCEQVLRGHTASVTAMIMLPNEYLASGSDDNTIRVWCTVTGECKHVLCRHTSLVSTMKVSQWGDLVFGLVSGSPDGHMNVWY